MECVEEKCQAAEERQNERTGNRENKDNILRKGGEAENPLEISAEAGYPARRGREEERLN